MFPPILIAHQTVFNVCMCFFPDMRRDVQEIFRSTPHEKQVMMFSATLSKDIRPVCKKFMQDVRQRNKPSLKYLPTATTKVFRESSKPKQTPASATDESLSSQLANFTLSHSKARHLMIESKDRNADRSNLLSTAIGGWFRSFYWTRKMHPMNQGRKKSRRKFSS